MSSQSSYDGDVFINPNHQQLQSPQSTNNIRHSSAVIYSTVPRANSRIDENNNKKPPPPPPLPPSTPNTPVSTLRSQKSEISAYQRQQSTACKNEKFNNAIFKKILFFLARKSFASEPHDDMQEELKNVLALFRERRKHLEIHKTPDVFITKTSNPGECETWLRAKGFEERTVKKLNGLSGNELFKLNKSTLEEYFGAEEGRRLASQITIQKNVSGVRKL